MCMTSTQKQLVENHMELVPRMVHAMTRCSTKTSAEERKELCQVGYLALCRAATMYEQDLGFKPYATTAIRHAIYDYWRDVRRDRERLCSLESHIPDCEELTYSHLVSERKDTSASPETAANVSAVKEYVSSLKSRQCSTIQKGLDFLFLQQQGYTSNDLSVLYHIPANHVRAWQSKARKLLRQDETLHALLT